MPKKLQRQLLYSSENNAKIVDGLLSIISAGTGRSLSRIAEASLLQGLLPTHPTLRFAAEQLACGRSVEDVVGVVFSFQCGGSDLAPRYSTGKERALLEFLILQTQSQFATIEDANHVMYAASAFAELGQYLQQEDVAFPNEEEFTNLHDRLTGTKPNQEFAPEPFFAFVLDNWQELKGWRGTYHALAAILTSLKLSPQISLVAKHNLYDILRTLSDSWTEVDKNNEAAEMRNELHRRAVTNRTMIQLNGAHIRFPADFIVVWPEKFGSSSYAVVIQCTEADAYGIPTFIAPCSKKYGRDLTIEDTIAINTAVTQAWPRFAEIVSRQSEIVYGDAHLDLESGWKKVPLIGHFVVSEESQFSEIDYIRDRD